MVYDVCCCIVVVRYMVVNSVWCMMVECVV